MTARRRSSTSMLRISAGRLNGSSMLMPFGIVVRARVVRHDLLQERLRNRDAAHRRRVSSVKLPRRRCVRSTPLAVTGRRAGEIAGRIEPAAAALFSANHVEIDDRAATQPALALDDDRRFGHAHRDLRAGAVTQVRVHFLLRDGRLARLVLLTSPLPDDAHQFLLEEPGLLARHVGERGRAQQQTGSEQSDGVHGSIVGTAPTVPAVSTARVRGGPAASGWSLSGGGR